MNSFNIYIISTLPKEEQEEEEESIYHILIITKFKMDEGEFGF